jgi:sirohydrochlorin ferrochelatase
MITQLAEQGERCFVVIPHFFGPSASLAGDIIPQLQLLKQKYPDLDASVAPPLICRCPMLFPSPKHYGDDIIRDIIHDRIRTTAETHSLSKYAVVLVDHGSPQPAVARVRNYVADTLGPLVLASDAVAFAQCCMERREGAEYDFNGVLLEKVLEEEAFVNTDVIVALMFLGPGKHAGAGGDIATIIKDSTAASRGRVFMTDVLGMHPKLIELLVKRSKQAVALEVYASVNPAAGLGIPR